MCPPCSRFCSESASRRARSLSCSLPRAENPSQLIGIRQESSFLSPIGNRISPRVAHNQLGRDVGDLIICFVLASRIGRVRCDPNGKRSWLGSRSGLATHYEILLARRHYHRRTLHLLRQILRLDMDFATLESRLPMHFSSDLHLA